MAKLTIKEDLCKGCGLCVSVCPKKILRISESVINKKGYSPLECFRPEDCIGCAFCATMCPDCVISVER